MSPAHPLPVPTACRPGNGPGDQGLPSLTRFDRRRSSRRSARRLSKQHSAGLYAESPGALNRTRQSCTSFYLLLREHEDKVEL